MKRKNTWRPTFHVVEYGIVSDPNGKGFANLQFHYCLQCLWILKEEPSPTSLLEVVVVLKGELRGGSWGVNFLHFSATRLHGVEDVLYGRKDVGDFMYREDDLEKHTRRKFMQGEDRL
ncbi:hypothetical protein FF1_025583 [Malus domestica]